MSLIEQWANNLGETETINGSWIQSIAKAYKADIKSNNILLDIAIKLQVRNTEGDLYQEISLALGGREPLNGSWIERIVQKTRPR